MKSLADQGVKGKIPPWEGINIYRAKPGSLVGVGLLDVITSSHQHHLC